MKIALVHEFLTQFGGAERVLKNFLEIWPAADIHVLIYNEDKTRGEFSKYSKKVSYINSLPGAKRDHKFYLPLMPSGVERFNFAGYDAVVSDSSSFAKGAITGSALHVCYCHTPTRFLWTEMDDYLRSQPYPELLKLFAKPTLSWLRNWDYKAAQRPHYFIANSSNIQKKIKNFYGRESSVIYPPVDTEIFRPQAGKGDYFLVASRLEPYKRIDLVIDVFNKLGWKLKVAGTGTQSEKLKNAAKSNIEFLGRVSDEELSNIYSGALAFIFPGEEDAGIMLLEAQACGTAVIAFGRGGALELVKPGKTGLFFSNQSVESLKEALLDFRPENYKTQDLLDQAKRYDSKSFQEKIKNFVESKFAEHKERQI